MADQALAGSIRRSVQEPGAFRYAYSAMSQPVLAFVLRRVYDADTAVDLMAETFAQAFIGARGFRGATDDEARSWLFGIAANQVGSYTRKCRVERRALDRLGLEPPSLTNEELERVVELSGLQELRERVRDELQLLSEAQRQALQLRIIDELDYPEVASRMGVSETAARARVGRGLRALSMALTPMDKKEMLG